MFMIHVPMFEFGSSIPKIIHQTYPDINKAPAEIRENIEYIAGLNPTWEYRLYNDADIDAIITKYYGTDMLAMYHRIHPDYGASRVDFFRYLLMYAEGGLYLDIKGTLTKKLDDMLYTTDRFILSTWNNKKGGRYPDWGVHKELSDFERGEYQQWFIISAKGHPYMRQVINRVIDNITHYNILRQGVGRFAGIRVTGPIPYTLGIESIKEQHPHREVNSNHTLGIEYSIYEKPELEGHHKQLFKKHYSKLLVPFIKHNLFTYYSGMTLYFIRGLVLKVFTGSSRTE